MASPPSSPAASRARHRRLVALVVGLSFALNLVPVWWGLPDPRGWAVDEIRPDQVEGDRAWSDKYPPFHRIVLRAVFLPLDGLAAAGVVTPDRLERRTALFLISRLLSVLLATATVWCVYRAGRLFLGRDAALLAALSTAVSPPFVYYAKTANLETPYVFWFALSLYFFFRALDRHRLRDYLLFVAAATLAVATKDQAFALYLVSPLLLVAGLWRRRRGELPAARALAATLADRRVLLALATPFALTALIWAVGADFETLVRHFRFISGPAPAPYREFEPTFAGQATAALRALANAGFALGAPLSVAAAVALARALRRPAANARLLALAAIAVGYYLGFMAIVGYHYVRFFLPVVILMSLAAGKALADLLAARWCPRWASRAVVAAIFAAGLLRALAVDVAMATDARYRAERWLSGNAAAARTAGFGRGHILPRGVKAHPWEALARGGCGFLERVGAEVLVVNASALLGAREADLAAALESGHLGYELASRHPRGPALELLGVDRVDTNLDRIDPEIRIFRRSGRPCTDAAVVGELVRKVAETGDPALRRELAGALAGALAGTVELGAGRAAAISPDGWTRGTAAAALWVRNPGASPVAPRLVLACGAPAAELPLGVEIDDGGTVRREVFERPGRLQLRLAELAPGDERLVLVRSEKAWQPGGRDRRWLGVQVAGFELPAGRGDAER